MDRLILLLDIKLVWYSPIIYIQEKDKVKIIIKKISSIVLKFIKKIPLIENNSDIKENLGGNPKFTTIPRANIIIKCFDILGIKLSNRLFLWEDKLPALKNINELITLCVKFNKIIPVVPTLDIIIKADVANPIWETDLKAINFFWSLWTKQ